MHYGPLVNLQISNYFGPYYVTKYTAIYRAVRVSALKTDPNPDRTVKHPQE